MPTFDTPEPISVTVELGVGDIRVVASDRSDTIVEVRPSDDAKKSDVTAAQQTRVEYASGRLLIKAPKGWRQYTFRGGGESIDVQIDLPAGSTVRGDAGVAAFHCIGRLGECHLTTGVGEIHVDQAQAAVAAKTANGNIRLGEVAHGTILAQTGFGNVEIGVLDGVAAWLDVTTRYGNVHNSLDAAERPGANEDAVDVRARSSFGDITIRRASPARTTR